MLVLPSATQQWFTGISPGVDCTLVCTRVPLKGYQSANHSAEVEDDPE